MERARTAERGARCSLDIRRRADSQRAWAQLHIGLNDEAIDASKIFCGKVVHHTPHMTAKLAEYLRAERIEGRVAVVGDDVLPGRFDRVLRNGTPQIEWVPDETFLEGPQMIKSPRELEAYRVAGAS